MRSVTVKQEDIAAAVAAMLATIPDRRSGGVKTAFTDKQDALILAGWDTKKHSQLAKLVGCSESTMKRRHGELTEQRT